MYQIITTYIIVAAAVSVAVYRTVRQFSSPPKKAGTCGPGCTGCAVAEIKRHRNNEGRRTRDGRYR
jgi:hypothetical protein